MKAQELTQKLTQAKKGLATAHKYLSNAISNNNAEDETYYFEAVFRRAEIVNKLELQLKKISKVN